MDEKGLELLESNSKFLRLEIRKKFMSKQQNFHPLTQDNLKLFAQLYDGEAEDCLKLLNDLKKSRKGSMDDYTIGRVLKQYNEKLEYLDCAEKQFNKWLSEGSTSKEQTIEIQRLAYGD